MKLSLNDASNEAAAFVKREWRLLVPVAFLLNALPMAFATAILPGVTPGTMPQPGAWLLAIPVAAFVAMIGNVALCWLAMSPGRSVGDALKRAFSRALPLLLLYLLLVLALGLLFVVVAVFAAVVAPPRSADPAGSAGFVLLLIGIMGPVLIVAAVRLVMTAPVAAAEEGGAITILKRSLALTRPVFWPLLGFIILFTVLSWVIQIVVSAVVGIPVLILAGPPQPGGLSHVVLLLVGAAVSAVVAVFLSAMLARIYLRLSGRSDRDVFA